MNILLLPSTAFNNHTATISDPVQLNHIQHVLSPQIGDTLKIGELGGNMGVATVAKLDANHCVLTDVVLDKSPPAKLDLSVIVALPRPKVLRRLVLDMTAMGVGHIIFINSYRTDKSYWGSPLLARLDEFVLDGLQQGVDSVPPKISLAKRFKPFVQDELPSLITTPHSALVAHPYAPVHFNEQIIKHGLPKVLIIGAEGGFIPYEIELLASVGVGAVSVGERILRTESAVNALLGRWL